VSVFILYVVSTFPDIFMLSTELQKRKKKRSKDRLNANLKKTEQITLLLDGLHLCNLRFEVVLLLLLLQCSTLREL
jgi:hypothetical protein